MSGPRFVEPPASMFRRRPFIDPGLLALFGAILATLFILLLVGMLERGLGITLGDLLKWSLVAN